MTEQMQALVSKIPKRYTKKCTKQEPPGTVKKSALTYTSKLTFKRLKNS